MDFWVDTETPVFNSTLPWVAMASGVVVPFRLIPTTPLPQTTIMSSPTRLLPPFLIRPSLVDLTISPSLPLAFTQVRPRSATLPEMEVRPQTNKQTNKQPSIQPTQPPHLSYCRYRYRGTQPFWPTLRHFPPRVVSWGTPRRCTPFLFASWLLSSRSDNPCLFLLGYLLVDLLIDSPSFARWAPQHQDCPSSWLFVFPQESLWLLL